MPRGTRSRQPPSGRFVLRLDPGLHAALRHAARDAELSLNDYCARKLAAPVGCADVRGDLGAALARALELFGGDLLGAAVFGSYARGELTDTSDIDLLLVVAPGIRLGRDLYRRWDQSPLSCDGRSLEPQIVHMPPDAEIVAGLWAEIALDGIVLFDRSHRLSARLARVRRDIVAGRIVRRLAHGHPDWIKVA